MSDLIRRQDAIEAMYRLEAEDIETYGCFIPEGFDSKPAIEALKALPSAEPEEEAFEWCHDCKEYDQKKHCCHRWTKVIRQTIEEMKAESERKWIPVTEALPEEEKDVLVSVHFESYKSKTVNLPQIDYVEIASHIEGVWSSLSDEYKAVEVNHHVVAWMPLPEPWRGDE